MTTDDRRRCPDDGTCHHECTGSCFRVLHCGPLSAARYPDDRWPADVVAANPAEPEPVAIPEGCNELCRRQAAALLLGPLKPSTHTCAHGHGYTLAELFPAGG